MILLILYPFGLPLIILLCEHQVLLWKIVCGISISCQLIIEFLSNVTYQVKEALVNELGNNLSLR